MGSKILKHLIGFTLLLWLFYGCSFLCTACRTIVAYASTLIPLFLSPNSEIIPSLSGGLHSLGKKENNNWDLTNLLMLLKYSSGVGIGPGSWDTGSNGCIHSTVLRLDSLAGSWLQLLWGLSEAAGSGSRVGTLVCYRQLSSEPAHSLSLPLKKGYIT